MNPPPKRANPYKRLFAYMMSSASVTYDKMVADRKRALLGGLHGSVLEIGAGTAPNLSYYPADVNWIGIDPNPAMFPYAQKEAQRLGRQIELRSGQSEQLDMPDGSMDAIVSTLVICSVHDPHKTLQEIMRVLRPGGQFVFIEHVAAPAKSSLRSLQRLINPFWKLGADGCHLDRETWTVIEGAGFNQVNLDHFRIESPLISPHIAGFAVK